MDKVLALRGGGELVALWAQLASAIDVVSGVVMNGIAMGLAVLVAQTADPQRQRDLLGNAMVLGLAVALPVAAAMTVLGWPFFGPSSAGVAFIGWVAVIPGLLNGYWLGQQRRDRMLALAAGSALVACAAALTAPRSHVLEVLALSQVLPALALLLVARPSLELAAARRALGRYVLPGLAVGILGPLSMLAARGVVAEAMSWHEAGVLQALWRTSDWVCGFAGGVLSVHYLPRFAAARTRAELAAEMRRAAKAVLIASAAVFAVMLAFHRELLAWLYDPGVRASHSAAALIFAGSLVRIASWIALFALYAVRATGAIALGELLSLPLFAALLALSGKHLSLELAGWLWLLSFSAYAAFNFGAVFWRRRDAAAS